MKKIISAIGTAMLALSLAVNAFAAGLPQWHSYRGGNSNTAICEGDLPVLSEHTKLNWALKLREPDDWQKYVSEPLIIDGKIYLAVGGELLVITDGNITARTTLAAANEYTCRPVCTNGLIVIPLANGVFQALAADTLKSLWVTDPIPEQETESGKFAHQTVTTLTADGGYIYAGTACADWTASYYGLYLCINAENGKTVWKHENQSAGYYWSGAAVANGSVVTAGDDGILISFDAATGTERSRAELGASARSTVASDGKSVYLTTVDGNLHKLDLSANGVLSGHKKYAFAGSSTSTPAVYGGKIYVGGAAADYSGGVFAVVNADTMTAEQLLTTAQEVKSAPLIGKTPSGTAVYYTVNDKPGGMFAYSAAAKKSEQIFTPAGDTDNYCTASVISDGKNLYYTNDSGYLFSLGKAEKAAPPITDVGRVNGLKVVGRTASSIKLSWSKLPGANGYYIYDGNKRVADVKSNTVTLKKIKAGSVHKLSVQAYKAASGKVYAGIKSGILKTAASPAKVKRISIAKGKRSFKAKWKKASGADGYQIRYTLKKRTRTKLVSKTSVKISKLKSGKKYRVSIRAFKKLNGKKLYGAYGKTMSVTVK